MPQAIGALCADAGTAMSAQYSVNGTGINMTDVQTALAHTFQYQNVMLAGTGAQLGIPLGALYTMVNPNLDAGYPVLFGIIDPAAELGHCIVCDGYGYVATTMYHHLNLGWAGMCNSWYNLPSIPCPEAEVDFTILDACVYNVYPSGSGEIISGRVLDSQGNPASGATVSAVGGGRKYTAVTNARGIYAFTKLPSGTGFTLTAAKVGLPTRSIITATGTSLSQTTSTDSLACGNVWGADFCSPQVILQTCCTPLAAPGAVVSYLLTCSNNDGLAATNLQLSDTLPAQLAT